MGCKNDAREGFAPHGCGSSVGCVNRVHKLLRLPHMGVVALCAGLQHGAAALRLPHMDVVSLGEDMLEGKSDTEHETSIQNKTKAK